MQRIPKAVSGSWTPKDASDPVRSREAAPKPPALPVETVLHIKDQVAGALARNEREISFDLIPAHLGRLKVRLHVDGFEVRAELIAETVTAREALESRLPDLTKGLSQQGLELKHFDVQLDSQAWRGHSELEGQDPGQEAMRGPVERDSVEHPLRPIDRIALGLNTVDRVA